MKHKYNGSFPEVQFGEYKKRVHSWVHWFLIYAEQKNPILNDYFIKVQRRLNGLNELINYPVQLVEIMNLIESARLEINKSNYSFEVYRKLILDIHDLIDMLPEGD